MNYVIVPYSSHIRLNRVDIDTNMSNRSDVLWIPSILIGIKLYRDKSASGFQCRWVDWEPNGTASSGAGTGRLKDECKPICKT
ncbi:hypothetical protein HYC85_009149 [Camellia sinensis]|uniref:Uncharacterized protein n=1 Tax=Camellia sinensis TaxID=4442 RepID=A0A7J7HF23_CAMSI|nr:hypothetical protein HYC85_009149 [Camellia sinensis]